jgi:ribosomal-protein-alanine N-acetyltransferase
LIAHRSAEILGFIVAESDGRGSGHIITIDVSPRERRSGVGSQLLAAAEERLRAVDCHNIYLETAVNNLDALAFYKRHKYEIIKTIPRYYDNSLDALRMVKRLNY